MNIWITSAWYPTRNSTSGIFVKEQAEALQRAGHNVTVLIITYSSPIVSAKNLYRIPEAQYEESSVVKVIRFHVNMLAPASWSSDPRAFQKRTIQKSLIKQAGKYAANAGAPDIIHHHCLSDNAYVAEALAEKFKVPYVFTEHSNFTTDDELNKFNTFETFADRKRFLQNSACNIAVSNVRAECYSRIYSEKFVAVYNLVSDVFRISPVSSVRMELPFRFCSVGILEKRKRHDILIAAFSEIHRQFPDTVLEIAGAGALMNQYREIVSGSGLKEAVIFKGKLGRTELVELFDRSHVHVLPSDEETFGIVHAEAMFRGIPVISTVCGGPEEFIRPPFGLLCSKESIDELVRCMTTVITEYSLFKAEEIRTYATDLFSEKVITEQLSRIYLDAVQKNNGR